MSKSQSVIPSEKIERAILLFRGEKVMLDSDLALLYGVETKYLCARSSGILRVFPRILPFNSPQRSSKL